MKKLLIAGGSHAEIPLINAARNLGYHVTTSGNRVDDLGHRISDAYEPCDYSDPESVLDTAKRIGAHALCASSNDFSALSCSFAAKELGLAGHDDPDIAKLIHHKDRWRSFAQAHGIPSPKAVGCSNTEEVSAAIYQLTFPIIVKPVDLTGGKGVQRADSYDEAISAANSAFALSRAKKVVLEEFIDGTKHGFTCILRDSRIVFYFSDDEVYHLSQYLVSAAFSPTSSSQASIDSLIRYSEYIACSLKLTDGVFHVQFIERADGTPIIIEICRRSPGDLYVDLVRHATGAPYAEWIVRASIGDDLKDVSFMPPTRCVTRHCLMTDRRGVFSGFDFDSSVESRIIDSLIWGRAGDIVTDPFTHKFGIVFIEYDSLISMRAEAPLLQNLLRPIIKSA
jgi:biotin carboxylase